MSETTIDKMDEINSGIPDSPNTNAGREISLFRKFRNLSFLSMKRSIFSRNVMVLLILGGMPLIVALFYSISFYINSRMEAAPQYASPMQLNSVFQVMFRTFYIHFIIFFIASIFGFSLLRKEIEDQTLHYLFLQPVNKTMIILSKFTAFVVLVWLFLSAVFLTSYIVFFIPLGAKVMVTELFTNHNVFALIQEVFVMLLALLIYGSISMVMGSIFKSGIYAVFFYVWEVALPYLPSTMKYFTISHYLQAITPPIERSAIPPKFFELFSELPPIWLSLLVLFIILAAFIGATAFIIRQYECRYAGQ